MNEFGKRAALFFREVAARRAGNTDTLSSWVSAHRVRRSGRRRIWPNQLPTPELNPEFGRKIALECPQVFIELRETLGRRGTLSPSLISNINITNVNASNVSGTVAYSMSAGFVARSNSCFQALLMQGPEGVDYNGPRPVFVSNVSGVTLSNVVIAGTTYNTSLTAPAT